jgi:voltage-gated potassium channel
MINMSSQIYRRFIWSGVILVIIIAIGTVGYWFIGGREHSFLDALYMTVITISTIGFSEVIDLTGNPAGRAFTIFIAVAGVGVLMYVVTNITALIVEGELRETFRRRRMEKMASRSKDHYIVCGIGSVGSYIINELHSTGRPYVILDTNKENIESASELLKNEILIEGDATDSKTLLKAGIEKAKGLFAVTGDDNENLVITLTAKQLNSELRVVARCKEIESTEKLKKVGADAVVSPSLIGGLRMASEMIRPTVVSFLDIMLRDKEKNLRVEEVAVPETLVGKTISDLNLHKFKNTLLLAIQTKDDWIYNPPADYVIEPENTLVLMTTPQGRGEVEKLLNSKK